MREQFEKLPEIAERLEWCYFQESTGEYWSRIAHSEDFEYQTNYVNGACMMYQEMQREKDLIDEKIAYAVKHIGKTNETSIRVLQGILK